MPEPINTATSDIAVRGKYVCCDALGNAQVSVVLPPLA
jgi:hypothetical protein